MWSQDDAIIRPSVAKLSFLCPDSTSKPSMSFLNSTFENVSFELTNNFKEPKEELFESFNDTEKEESEVEITLEVQDLEKLVDSSRDSDIKTEPSEQLDVDKESIFENLVESDKGYDHQKMIVTCDHQR